MERVVGVVQHYAWGDRDFIPGLLGVEPDGQPWAELWLGTHTNGPTHLEEGRPLIELSGKLPYLLKVLAAAEPLSLQTHPNAQQASAGYSQGIYPDSNAKPELLCALTTFRALCGIRPVGPTIDLLDHLGADQLADVLRAEGPGSAFTAIYRGRVDAQQVVDACSSSDRIEAQWVRKLDARYPRDPSVAATVLLNHVVLEPGEALRLDAGNVHAYLEGAGIELMGASDNVVRAGLTQKPVDIDLLLDVFDPTPLEHPVMEPTTRYELGDANVSLVRLESGESHTAVGHELTIDLAGGSFYLAPGDHTVVNTTTFVVTPLQ